ncbi:hypothetical protein TNCV_816021 [Trichonephila clavipes]|nr:hypothetical protein TNCV_816021 [Trichonephila clavipes]
MLAANKKKEESIRALRQNRECRCDWILIINQTTLKKFIFVSLYMGEKKEEKRNDDLNRYMFQWTFTTVKKQGRFPRQPIAEKTLKSREFLRK